MVAQYVVNTVNVNKIKHIFIFFVTHTQIYSGFTQMPAQFSLSQKFHFTLYKRQLHLPVSHMNLIFCIGICINYKHANFMLIGTSLVKRPV